MATTTRPITDESNENLLDESGAVLRDEQSLGAFYSNSGRTFEVRRPGAFEVGRARTFKVRR